MMKKYEIPSERDQVNDDLLFGRRFPTFLDETIDTSSHDLKTLLAISAQYSSAHIDTLKSLSPKSRPPMIHVTCHRPLGGEDCRPSVDDRNQNYRFIKAEFTEKSDELDVLAQRFGAILQEQPFGYSPNGPHLDALNAFLDDLEGTPCVLGSVYLADKVLDANNPDNAQGPPLNYSPHVIPQKAHNKRGYISGSLTKCLRRFRTKNGWVQYYGWGQRYGKRATVCIIDRKFWPFIERVGCTGVGQNDLGSSLLPLQISTIYYVTWNSVNLHDSTWRKVFDKGVWISTADQVELSYDDATAEVSNAQ
jgi:hypothetical protein